MMDTPLVLTSFLNRADKYFGHKEIISRTSPVNMHHFTYTEFIVRTKKLAAVLEKLGLQRGMKIGSFAWNHHRHLEAYFAVPCSGAILHMINIRLSPEHLIHIINHAEDEILLVDDNLLPLIIAIHEKIPTVKKYIIMGDDVDVAKYNLPNAYSYEELLAQEDGSFVFPDDLDENLPAGLCYTSATTGLPKGVIYTHRGLVLHAISLGMTESQGISERDVTLAIVPMFHVNAWGMPFASVNFGANQVMPGPMFTPKLILQLIEAEKVTLTAGVPTIWLGVMKELEEGEQSYDISSLRMIVSGGAASPKGLIHLFEQKYHVPFVTGYGLTETTPMVSTSGYTSLMDDWTDEERLELRSSQGFPPSLVEVKIVNENGEVPRDATTMGEIIVRGPWIANEYYKDAKRTEEAFRDGWLYTGDIATLGKTGNIKVIDRKSDLIKSGGEWISSVDLENALMSHEAVFEAAVIGVPDPKWQERPLACIVLKNKEDNHEQVEAALREFLEKDFAKWWIPEEFIFLDEIPKTSVGKFLKMKLREDVQK